MVIFGDQLTWNNIAGAAVVIVAVLVYAYIKSDTTSRTTAAPGGSEEFQRVRYSSAPAVQSDLMPIPKLELTIVDDHEKATPRSMAQLEQDKYKADVVQDQEAMELLTAIVSDRDDDCTTLSPKSSMHASKPKYQNEYGNNKFVVDQELSLREQEELSEL